MTERVVVIGAGVIGAAVALELARAGHPTTVVERTSGAGMGSTSASSAIIRFGYTTDDGAALAYESLHYWQSWRHYLGLPAEAMLTRFVQCGKVLLDAGDGLIDRTIGPTERAGARFEIWNGDELRARMPQLDAHHFGPPRRADDPAFWDEPTRTIDRAVWTPEAGYVSDPQLAAQNLATAARAAGADVRYNVEVTAIERNEQRVTGVELDGGEVLPATVVVNVAGPHSSHLNRMAGVAATMAISTRPLRQQVDICLAPPPVREEIAGLPVVGDLDAGTYFRPEHDGILVGGIEAPCDPMIWLDDPDDVDLTLHADEWETKTLRLARRVPAMGVPLERRGVVGVYDVSDDWLPILDRSDLDGFFMACGTSGNQFKNAPGIGHCMTQLIEAVAAGHDHDRDPVVVTGRHTGLRIDLGTFSRLRDGAASSGTVMG